jgi:hypothetical protein
VPQWLVQRRVQQRIDDVSTVLKPEATEMASLVKGQVKGVIPALDRIASDTEYGGWLARLIDQAGAKAGVSTVLLSSLALGAATAFAVTAVLRQPWGLLPGFLAGASIPILVLMRKRTMRCGDSEFFPRPWTCCPAPSRPAMRSRRRWAWSPTRAPIPSARVQEDVRRAELRSAIEGRAEQPGHPHSAARREVLRDRHPHSAGDGRQPG